jgi:hypothetical protein
LVEWLSVGNLNPTLPHYPTDVIATSFISYDTVVMTLTSSHRIVVDEAVNSIQQPAPTVTFSVKSQRNRALQVAAWGNEFGRPFAYHSSAVEISFLLNEEVRRA